MCYTVSRRVEIDESIVTTLSDIYGIESDSDAVEFALMRIADILEIEMLRHPDSIGEDYVPDFDAAAYLTAPPEEGSDLDDERDDA